MQQRKYYHKHKTFSKKSFSEWQCMKTKKIIYMLPCDKQQIPLGHRPVVHYTQFQFQKQII